MGGRLAGLTRHDERGRLVVRIVGDERGDFVLANPEEPAGPGVRELDGLDCMRLAAAATEGPPLVAERPDGALVVLPEEAPDLETHLPLSVEDADVLLGPAAAFGRFGRRTDDVIPLAPWAPGAYTVVFDPQDPGFADVPLVEAADDVLSIVRGELHPDVLRAVARHVTGEREPGIYGVFTNPLREFAVVALGESVEPHQDLRDATLLQGRGLMDGAVTLDEAARMLRSMAARLESAHAAGWRLAAPVQEDRGFPERADRAVLR